MHAVRNIKLCTKDCLCLYVCPTGATNTETGQIDASKCIGCGKCTMACPSHAITMIPEEYPKQQPKEENIVKSMNKLAKDKIEQEIIARKIAKDAKDEVVKQFARALEKSNRLMAEDIYREAGYMLPQSNNTHELLLSLLKDTSSDFPKEKVEELLRLIKSNEK